jgi:hypothetical protein
MPELRADRLYRCDGRLGGVGHAQAALASLRAAATVLSPSEQGLLLRMTLDPRCAKPQSI